MKYKLFALVLAFAICVVNSFAQSVAGGIGVFSVSETLQVMFSPGNLQFNAAEGTHECGDGTSRQGTWRFADNQWDYIGSANLNISSTYDGWTDLFGWGTGYKPTEVATSTGKYSVFTDWGLNVIRYGGTAYEAGMWRTLSRDEWVYLVHGRENAKNLFGMGTVNGVNGFILLPDDWEVPDGLTFTPATKKSMKWYDDMGVYSGGSSHYSDNTYTESEWLGMEEAGAVFMPACGYRSGSRVNYVASNGYYWSSTQNAETHETYDFNFRSAYFRPQGVDTRSNGFAVRLVWDIPYTLTVQAEGNGTVTGEGSYKEGETAILKATPDEDYAFSQWSDGNTDNPRQVVVTRDVTYTAVFVPVLSGITLQENGDNDYYTRFAEDYDGQTVKTVTLNRRFVKNRWSTLCLPFNVNKAMFSSLNFGSRIYEFKYATGDADTGVSLYFSIAKSIEAGKGYIVNADDRLAARTSFTFPGVKIDLSADKGEELNSVAAYDNLEGSSAEGNIELVGTLRKGILQGASAGNTYMGLKDNMIYYPNIVTGSTILAYRGIFRSIKGTLNAERIRIIVDGEDMGELRIDNGEILIDSSSDPSHKSDPSYAQARKYLRNGVLFIDRNGITYTAQGHRID